jgi:protein SCO1
MRILALLGVALAVAGCGGTAAKQVVTDTKQAPPVAAPAPSTGVPIPADTTAADFALRDQNGRLVRLSALHGRLVFLSFLYTHCTDVCPLIATSLDDAVRQLGHAGRNVTVLAVSVDPAGDTPADVRTYMRERHLGPEFHWLLGTRAQLAPVWQSYNILVEPRTSGQVAHAGSVFLLDREGRPRMFYDDPRGSRALVHDARMLFRRS